MSARIELELMAKAGVEVPTSSSRYSINENLLGVTLSGQEIDEFGAPGGDTHVWWQAARRMAGKATGTDPRIRTRDGQLSLDDKPMAGPELLAELNRRLGAYGVGRHIYTRRCIDWIEGSDRF